MKKTIIFFTFAAVMNATGQGVSGTHSFGNGYQHNIDALLCSGSNTYTVTSHNEFHSVNSYKPPKLAKLNAQGEKLWELSASPAIGEIPSLLHMTDDGAGGATYIVGSRQDCDYSTSFRYAMRNVGPDGTIYWEQQWIASSNSSIAQSPYIHCLTRDENGKYLHHFSHNSGNFDTSSVTIMNPDGSIYNILHTVQHNMTEVRMGTHFYLIGSSGNKLYGIDNNGDNVDSLTFEEPIRTFLIYNDIIYVLTKSKLYSCTQNFTALNVLSLSQYTQLLKFKREGNQLLALAYDGLYHVLTITSDLQLGAIKTIPEPLPVQPNVDFNAQRLSIGLVDDLYMWNASRMKTYDLNQTQSITTNWTDIGISDIEVTEMTVQDIPNSFPGTRRLRISVQVKLTNYGVHTLSSFRVHYAQNMGIVCGYYGVSQAFENLNLAPGASTWLNLGLIHDQTTYFQAINGVFQHNLCVYTSFPNNHNDEIVNNDACCKNVIFGHVGLDEHVSSTHEKQLLRIVDLLGREIPFRTNQVMIYQ